MISNQTLAILLRNLGQALEKAAAEIQPIPDETPASAEVVPIRQPQQTTPPQAAPLPPQQTQQTQQAQPTLPKAPPASQMMSWEQTSPAATLQDVANAFRQLQQVQGPGPIVDRGGILEQFGIARVSEAKPEQYSALIAAAQQRMSRQPGAA